MHDTFQIGELAREGETPVETIRYYEREGLLPAPRRSAGNFRLYGEAHRERLIFIRQCRSLDLTLAEIRRLLTLRDRPEEPCNEVNALLDSHIDTVSQRIAGLERLRRDLKALRRQCHEAQGTANCGILAGLASGTATRTRNSRRRGQGS